MGLCSADFEKGTNGNTITISDLGSATAWDTVNIAGSATLTYSNAHSAHGSLAAAFTANANQVELSWNSAFGTLTNHYGRLYLYQTTRVQGNFMVVEDSGGKVASLSQQASGVVDLNDANATWVTTANALPTNAWCRVEWRVIHSATLGQVTCRLFLGANVDGSTPDEEAAMVADRDTHTQGVNIRIGSYDAAGVFWLDDIVAGASGWPGPASAAPAAATGRMMLLGVG